MTRDEWIQYGVVKGWCLPERCLTHDGTDMTLDEIEYDDSCIFFLQLRDDE